MIPEIPKLRYREEGNFFLIAGPCVVESENLIMETAKSLVQMCDELHIPLIFKSSFTKANRSSVNSFTGIETKTALEILKNVGRSFSIPVITDVHSEQDVELVSESVDAIQIPAFLCRQTSLLLAAAKSGKAVNVKKGQFLSPDSMKFVAEKLTHGGCSQIMLTERGTTFGYSDLVVDFRGIKIMQQFMHPIVMDVTHSLQQPNQSSGVTGGQPEMIETIAKAAIAVGCDGLFIETHPDPKNALSDGANMLRLNSMKSLMEKLIKIRKAIL
ncbi:MAG TPA: 3-deoxy-8-phosphooctulonate synthase [Bacteroidia bacterium]|nr:3-deoxy-8-phosphooctulonate synthase [Bacteroidia bacterium]